MSEPLAVELVTHDGTFHADDVLCYALLTEVVSGEVRLIRTRDPAFTTPAENRMVFDVGGIHDAERWIFDHHQVDKTLRTDGSPYSAFGLLWQYLGIEYIASLDLDLNIDILERMRGEIDEGFVREIDAYDNGTAGAPAPVGHLSSLIEDLVPRGTHVQPSDVDQAFVEASQTAGMLFKMHVYRTARAWKDIVNFQKAADLSILPRVAVLPDGMSWKKAVYELGLDDLLYVVHPKEDGDTWYCAAVPPAPGSFAQRQPLPSAWAGKRDQDFADATGVEDAVFCHGALFLCAARTKAGAIELARQAVEAGGN